MFYRTQGQPLTGHPAPGGHGGQPAAMAHQGPAPAGIPAAEDLPMSPSGRKKGSCLASLLNLLVALAVLAGAVYLTNPYHRLLGYLNPGIRFTVFAKQPPPEDFSKALSLIRESCFGELPELQKWQQPIRLQVQGDPTDRDREALARMAEAFSSLPGFPGLTITEEEGNATIIYAAKDNFKALAQQYGSGRFKRSFCTTRRLDGVICEAVIVLEPGGLQGYRNSVMLHECFHMIGFQSHPTDRESVLNTIGPVPSLSPTDQLAFRMVYDPGVSVGDSYDEIAAYFNGKKIEDYTGIPAVAEPGKIAAHTMGSCWQASEWRCHNSLLWAIGADGWGRLFCRGNRFRTFPAPMV